MFELSDGFISLPGGLGTLDETFEIMTWKQLKVHDKPVIMLDIGGYWSEMKVLLEAIIHKGFAGASSRDLCQFAGSVADVFSLLEGVPEQSFAPQPERL